MTFKVVEPGTEIEHEGETLTVTRNQVVQKNGTIYLTQSHYDALKAHAEVEDQPNAL